MLGSPLRVDYRKTRYKINYQPFISTQNLKEPLRNENIKKVTILLVGTTGVGKSTFGNFLLDLKENEKPFEVSRRTRGTTKPEHRSKFLPEFRRNYHIMDTPGLEDKEDIQNMKKLWEDLEMQEINCVILCLDFSLRENNVNTIDTVKYYKELLSLVCGNFFVVITKTTKTSIFSDENSKRRQSEYIQQFLTLVGLDVPLIEFSNIDKDFDHHMTIVRERILHLASQMPPTSFLNCGFPLPPRGKEIQKRTLKRLRKKQKKIQCKIKNILYQEENGVNLLKEIDCLSKLKQELKEKSGIQISGQLYIKGDELIYIGNVPVQTISIPENFINIELKFYVWNCSVVETNRSREDGMVKIYFDIVPDIVNIVKNSVKETELESRWCTYIWVEYVRPQFDKELVDLKERISNSEKSVDNLKKILSCRERDLKREKHLDNINRQVHLLKKEKFSKEEIEDVLQIIREDDDES